MTDYFVPRVSDNQDTSYFVDRKEGEKWDTFVEENKEKRGGAARRSGGGAVDTPETRRRINEINNDFKTARSIGNFEFKNVEELKRVNSQRRNQFLTRRHSVAGTLRLRNQKKSGKKGLVCSWGGGRERGREWE
jgi:hypothetical protein